MAAPDAAQPTLESLASKVTELSAALSGYMKQNNMAEPSFAADSPITYPQMPPELFMARQTLQDTLLDMLYLTQGPTESIFNQVHKVRRVLSV
jgi:hypothetical protein